MSAIVRLWCWRSAQVPTQAYADAQQTINLRILERFRTREVSFIATAPRAVRLHPPLTPAADAGGQQRVL